MSYRKIADGVEFNSTPSHGYYRLTEDRLPLMPEALRLPDNLYEEDLEVCRIIVAFPHLFENDRSHFLDEGVVERARRNIKDYYPDVWEAFTGEAVPTSESSVQWSKWFFGEEHQGKLIAYVDEESAKLAGFYRLGHAYGVPRRNTL